MFIFSLLGVLLCHLLLSSSIRFPFPESRFYVLAAGFECRALGHWVPGQLSKCLLLSFESFALSVLVLALGISEVSPAHMPTPDAGQPPRSFSSDMRSEPVDKLFVTSFSKQALALARLRVKLLLSILLMPIKDLHAPSL